jgi:hypothetical protein
MDKITYLRKTKEKINEEYLEKLHLCRKEYYL